MKKKPMSSVEVKVNLVFLFSLILVEAQVLFDKEMGDPDKLICSCIFLPIIIIFLIILIKDFILRKKYEINLVPTQNEKEEIISTNEWNYNQRQYQPGERTIYDEKINEALGERFIYVKKTDKYGNVVFENRSNNIVNFIAGFVLGVVMNIIALVAFLNGELNIFGLLIILLFFVPITIFSKKEINRIKKLKLEIKPFQVVKFVFMLIFMALILSGIFILAMGIDINESGFGNIFLGGFCLVMLLGFCTFGYQTILVLNQKNKEKSK